MLTFNEFRILECFFPTLERRTAKEIEVKSGLSHETSFRLLKGLVEKEYLKESKVGKTNVYDIIKNEESIPVMHHVFSQICIKKIGKFREKHNLLYRRLYELLNEIDPEGPAVLFGSYAKGNETKTSDIDLLCATTNKNVEKILKIFKTKYNLNIQVVVIKPSEFKNIKKDNPVFWKDLIEYGIVLDGIDLFCKEVLRD